MFSPSGVSAMKSDAGIWQIAADMITRYGPGAEREALKLANLMLDHGDPARQVEWLRVWTAIVLIRAQPAPTVQEAAD